jgi:putative ABC transport system permease protein
MQRVAIARALVNNPEILLADEPTGSLDSENSVQIAEILKEIARDRLVILVTHNAELAQQYSTRIVRLMDGRITHDSNPYSADTEAAVRIEKPPKKERKPAMSLATALSLSLNNLMTKKARTFLTSFAGSIGIIGIALILSLSSGMQGYIAGVQRDTMSNLPGVDRANHHGHVRPLLALLSGPGAKENPMTLIKFYSRNVMANMMDSMRQQMSTNDLRAFKQFIEGDESGIAGLANDIKYGYSTPMNCVPGGRLRRRIPGSSKLSLWPKCEPAGNGRRHERWHEHEAVRAKLGPLAGTSRQRRAFESPVRCDSRQNARVLRRDCPLCQPEE